MSKFTDFIVGKKVSSGLKTMGSLSRSISTKDFRLATSKELTQDVRNRIMFWISITGGVVQVLNFAYTYFFIR
jgi:hypothetical protein